MDEYVLDTDMISILQGGEGDDFDQIMIPLGRHRQRTMLTTVSFEEQFRGWFAVGNRTRDAESYADFSTRLLKTYRFYAAFPLVSFEVTTAPIFTSLRKRFRRQGTMDLRIAAIALSRKATVVTRNTQDFVGITELRIEDWTKPLRRQS